MEPTIGIESDNLTSVSHALNSILADEFILYTKTRGAHWNVEGLNFHSMHLYFESQYQALQDMIDEIAERIRVLGHYAVATLRQYIELTHLTEETVQPNSAEGFIKSLLNDHDTIIIHLRENINYFNDKLHDAGTADFITGLMEKHEKMAWMLRAHLK
ncbi:Dps family protein [Parafilimonas terrae]|jgi:starvation-inducible DNA-binding protein|uniref:Starvation-inducible DNA-binding protein n=1 Tax=Parafilimonas terrae TaxID=1465490 RepID=A0A1I5VXA7_9BACT|nr:DNA starvation/stationary phase protection protein [Parafilimonas terrae]SFQ12115.1 starvation-inducible DNA-binding protein [Parafilimonas terrae]